jgi:outer membrane protein TolC
MLTGLLLEVVGQSLLCGQPPPEEAAPLHAPTPLPPASPAPAGACPDPHSLLAGPVLSEGQPPQLPPAQPAPCDQPLPINLATALRLADARPLVIAAAQASVAVAVAQLSEAKVMWLPNVFTGLSYFHHDGGGSGNSGNVFLNDRDQFMVGGGLMVSVSSSDALFAPLAARQVLRARQIDVQTARNDALLATAEAYFNVQQARGRLAGAQDTVAKSRELVDRVTKLAKALVPPFEADRARAQLAESEQAAAEALEAWRFASAELTRTLRLNPAAVVVPVEPPYLEVTLLAPAETLDNLIPIGLTSRPELAAQQALVQATLVRLRQERLRPLMPSVILQGNPTTVAPGGNLMGGIWTSDVNGGKNTPWVGRDDINVQVLWELRNLGFGNRALVRERRAEQEQALIELFRVQDRVAAEVTQAHAQLVSAAVRIAEAEVGVQEALITYNKTLVGLGQTTRFGDLLVLVSRPQEAVAAIQQLSRAYDNYFLSVNDYNRSQFRLYRALGYPAGILACERTPGEVQPVDTSRPPQMAPVPEPCR